MMARLRSVSGCVLLVYVVTHLSNHALGLWSLRAADAVAAEDTRVTARLLAHFGIAVRTIALHEHNEAQAALRVCGLLASGQRVAYVSDAGTPAVSDPGAALVAAVSAAGHRVVAVPGVSSAITAVSVAGDTVGAGFRFIGFLPAKGGERTLALQSLAASLDTQVLFEAPHRIESLLGSLGECCGSRAVTVCRELTKQFESVVTRPATELAGWAAEDANRLRGEFVLVVHAVAPSTSADESAQHDRVLRTLLGELPLKQAVSLAATLTGAPRNALYARALELKDADAAP